MTPTAPASKALKSPNRLIVVSVISLDALVVAGLTLGAAFLDPSSWTKVVAMRAAIAGAAPVVVLFLSSLLSAGAKASLVFWRAKEALPGHRAFTRHLVDDPRIDSAKLESHIGPFPTDAGEQNRAWYRLFKKVEDDVSIAELHRSFLLMRDLAAVSAILCVATLLAWLTGLLTGPSGWASAGLFLFQYAVSALSARNHGIRLVSSVLAKHSLKKIR